MLVNRKHLDTALMFFRAVIKNEGYSGNPLVTIEADKDSIRMNTVTACLVVTASGDETWMKTVSLDDLSQIVKSSKSSQIEIIVGTVFSCDHPCLTVTTEHCSKQLPDCDEVIMSEYSEPLTTATIPAGELLQAIDACEHSIAREPGRYAINNLFLHCENSRLNVVSTDGRRMSHYMFCVEQPDFQAYIASDAVAYVRKQLAAASAVTIKTHTSKETLGHVCTIATSSSVTHHTTTGDFPRYQKVFPEDVEKLATLPASTFKGIIASLPKARKGEPEWLLQLDFTTECLTIKAAHESTDDKVKPTWETIKTLPVIAGKAKIAFRASYVSDFLDTLQEDSFELWFEESTSPSILKSGGLSEVVMPVRCE